MTPAEHLRIAHEGGGLLSLVALKNADVDLIDALADDSELLEIVERSARESRSGAYAGALRTALQLIASRGSDVRVRSWSDRHRRIAAIISAGGPEADRLVVSARAVCATWRAARLERLDYLEAWEGLLASSCAEIAAALVSESDDAYVYRQCSAFIRSPEWYAVTPARVPSIVDLARASIHPGQLNPL